MAYDFNGTNQSLNTGFVPPLGAEQRTLSAWFRCETFGDKKVFHYGTAGTGLGATFGITLETVSGSPFLLFRHAGGNIRYPASGLNVWQHVAALVPVGAQTTDDVVIYSGGLAATGTRNSGSNQTLNTSSTNLLLGTTHLANDTCFDGQIAEVGIWNVALTAEEIASLAKGVSCARIRPQSLKFHAPLVRDLIDTRGGLTITNNNAATVADHPRIFL